jgi:Asp-tRNA(Asn)/Glu-tRNA(Gln) amidotransferase A subunit family amidase
VFATAGIAYQGLPFGVQIVGPQFGDREIVALARFPETARQNLTLPPGCD